MEEQRNRFEKRQINQTVEQQRQHSTSIPVKPTLTNAQAVPNTNMVPHKEIEIDDNISVPSEEMYTRHRKFHERIDQFPKVKMCHVFQESYGGVHIRNKSTGPMCLRCLREGSNHIFLVTNHMDPGFQPRVLQDLTQVEEMLIARASQIL